MRLIDADELLDRVEWANTNPLIDHGEAAVKLIKAMPTIEAEPIKRGRWIDVNDYHIGTCSICGNRWGSVDEMSYCPNCGAKMDKEESEG